MKVLTAIKLLSNPNFSCFVFTLFVLILNMTHQTSDNFDFVTENVAQDIKDFSNPKINLLVTKKIHEISSKTSNPKRMTELIVNYIGLQSHHQSKLGHLNFMKEMIMRKVFTHEIQILAEDYPWSE